MCGSGNSTTECSFIWGLVNEENGQCLTRNPSGNFAIYASCGGYRLREQLLRQRWISSLDRYQFTLGDTWDLLAPVSLSGPFSPVAYVNEDYTERTRWIVHAIN
ncbi:hypothetical protein [Actinocorallia populi]|uniref:hypothetical protein n=1 Tax=Actinocorallia populi TaxID=2079200 RepID=UPI001300BC02|nr:hypothetical protein [Actinocorallia populi]